MLQREVAMRRRPPRWLVAVTGCAIVAAGGLGWLAAEHHRHAVAAHDRALEMTSSEGGRMRRVAHPPRPLDSPCTYLRTA